MFRILEKASNIAYFIGKWITFLYILGVTVLSIVGVFFRAGGRALTWNEELMRWLLISLAYIGASVGMRTRNHIGIEFFLSRLKFNTRKIIVLIGYVAIVVFLITYIPELILIVPRLTGFIE